MSVQGKSLLPMFCFAVLMLCLVVLSATSCSSSAPGTDRAPMMYPELLLKKFLEAEESAGGTKFVFSGRLELGQGQRHRFRGVCGYSVCGSLRMRLLGPLGFTLFEYLLVDDSGTVVTNRIIERDDRDGLVYMEKLMRILARALVDRCGPTDDFTHIGDVHGASIFRLVDSDGSGWLIRLDRRRAILLTQETDDDVVPAVQIEYSNYRLVGDRWVPRRMELSVRDGERNVGIEVRIRKWNTGVAFSEEFFSDPLQSEGPIASGGL